MRLTTALLTRWRQRLQSLTGATCRDAVDVVGRLGAVQAQDYGGASWAIALRLSPGATPADIDAPFDRGDILRTHVLRPTWHFVLPSDIRWMLQLTGPRILSAHRLTHSRLGLDAKTVARALTTLQRALEGGRFLNREELRRILTRARVPCTDTVSFSHVLMIAELEALVCSGPRRGKQFTYALLDERVPAAPKLDGTDAVRELVRRYFSSHAPATLHDFTVWSGLGVGDARRGIEALGDAFVSAEMNGKSWWCPAEEPPSARRSIVARLLPNFDEYHIGFKHREPLLERLDAHGVSLPLFQILSNLLVVDGQLVGSWKRVASRKDPTVALAPTVQLTQRERDAVESEVERFGRYLQLPTAADWVR